MTQSRAAARLAARRAPLALASPGVFGLLAGLGILAAAAFPAGADTLRVHPDSAAAVGPPYFPTILAANTIARPGDIIEVSSAGSPYTHSAVMTLNDGVTYRGGFGPEFQGPDPDAYETWIVLLLGATDSVIDCGIAGASTRFEGFTINGGNASFSGGGIFAGAGTALTIADCRIFGNYSDGIGGGITIGGGSSVQIRDCEIRGNVARFRGGGVSVAPDAADAVIEMCTVAACTSLASGGADGGGGLFVASDLLIRSTHVDSCHSNKDGGGLLVRNASPLLQSLFLHGNSADRNGGGLYCDGGSGELRDSEVFDCAAGRSGGGVYASSGAWRYEGSFLRRNVASGGSDTGGGAFHFEQPDGAHVLRNEISANEASEGGAIRVVAPFFRSILSLQIESNTIFRNAATNGSAGGGLHFIPFVDDSGNAGGFADLVLNNIISDTTSGYGIYCSGAFTQPVLRYNCMWNSLNYGGSCDDRTNINGNIRANPQYCDPDADPPNLKLGQFSPCAGAGEGGVDMGAFPLGSCTAVSIEPMTWGQLKAAYR